MRFSDEGNMCVLIPKDEEMYDNVRMILFVKGCKDAEIYPWPGSGYYALAIYRDNAFYNVLLNALFGNQQVSQEVYSKTTQALG